MSKIRRHGKSALAWRYAMLALLTFAALTACTSAQNLADSPPGWLPTAEVAAPVATQEAATPLPTVALPGPATPGAVVTLIPPATDLPTATAIPLSTEGQAHSVGAEEAEAARTRFQRLLRASWDTDFTRSTISFDEIMTGGPPKDGIPAIDNPKFETVAEADAWLDPREPVQVVDLNGDARAYPVQVMVWHEIVNDTVGDEPVVITF